MESQDIIIIISRELQDMAICPDYDCKFVLF